MNPGEEAIDAALEAVLGDLPPLARWQPDVSWVEGGNDPLSHVHIWALDEPVPHWLFVGYGMTELGEKQSPVPEVSGWGFEPVIRVANPDREATPPMWPVALLNALARVVWIRRVTLDAGEHVAPQEVYGPDGHTMDAILLRLDPGLPTFNSVNGDGEFLQAVPVSRRELEAIREWSPDDFLTVLEARWPACATAPDRLGLEDDPAAWTQLVEGAEREGSTFGTAFVEQLELRSTASGWKIRVSDAASDVLVHAWRRRLRHGRPFTLRTHDTTLKLVPGAGRLLKGTETSLSIGVPSKTEPKWAGELAAGARRIKLSAGRVKLELVVDP